MLKLIAFTLAAQWAPPIAVTNSPAPPVVIVPGPPYPGAAPLPPPGEATIVRAPQPRHDLRALVTPDDYPASALAKREEGRVGFTLDVGANGRATGCTVSRSSGSSALDSVTCMIMTRRARFTPAVDSNGMPRSARVEAELVWSIPSDNPGERG